MAPLVLKDIDFDAFWEDSDYAREEYVGAPLTEAMVRDCEQQLGYKLPASYIDLINHQNGGIPTDTNYPTQEPTSWAEDHVAVSGIFGCDSSKTYSLCGELGSQFMMDEWGYPDIGVYICDCPSGGHDMIALDYRKCGPNGEPAVVHVDQEGDYEITFLAKDFETFIRGLKNDEAYDNSDEELAQALDMIERGRFSSRLSSLIEQQSDHDFSSIIRKICKDLTLEKGYFAMHDDELSYLLYDIQFFLFTSVHKVGDKSNYPIRFGSMIAVGDGEFTSGGFAPGFIIDWMDKRIAQGAIIQSDGFRFTPEYIKQLLAHERVQEHRRN